MKKLLALPDPVTGDKLAATPMLLDKRQVAALLQFSPRHIDNLVKQGCPCLRFGTRRTRFEASEVLDWCKLNSAWCSVPSNRTM